MLFRPLAMHIPDGFLSVPVSIVLWAGSVVVVGLALKRVGKDLHERQVPMMGVMAAAIFAGQMLNFSVTGGTSGHLLGAAIATILLGPWSAVIVLTSVVSIQALVFQDGGLLALGANLFNMAFVGVTVSYFVYSSIDRVLGGRRWGVYLAGYAAAWMSIVVASLACALELAASGTSPANLAVPAMGGIHALIGVGEGLITFGALAFLRAARQDLLPAAPKGGPVIWALGLGMALLLAVLSPLASAHPDGLEWVAAQQGFLQAASGPIVRMIPDYVVPGVSNAALATIAAGVIGTLLVFGAALGVGYLRRSRKQGP